MRISIMFGRGESGLRSRVGVVLVKKVISGGQTGVDRAGLDAAMELGIEHGGYAPKGRKAEDGQIPARYKLEEMKRGGYPNRTKKNIESADGTIIFYLGKISRGTKLTLDHSELLRKPFLTVDVESVTIENAASCISGWIEANKIAILNVAGPRLSTNPVVSVIAKKILLISLK